MCASTTYLTSISTLRRPTLVSPLGTRDRSRKLRGVATNLPRPGHSANDSVLFLFVLNMSGDISPSCVLVMDICRVFLRVASLDMLFVFFWNSSSFRTVIVLPGLRSIIQFNGAGLVPLFLLRNSVPVQAIPCGLFVRRPSLKLGNFLFQNHPT